MQGGYNASGGKPNLTKNAVAIGSTYAFDFGIPLGGSKSGGNVSMSQQKQVPQAPPKPVSPSGYGSPSDTTPKSTATAATGAPTWRPSSQSAYDAPPAGMQRDIAGLGGWVSSSSKPAAGPGASPASIGILNTSSTGDDPFSSLLAGVGKGAAPMKSAKPASSLGSSGTFSTASLNSALPTNGSVPGGQPMRSGLGSPSPAASTFDDPFSAFVSATASAPKQPQSSFGQMGSGLGSPSPQGGGGDPFAFLGKVGGSSTSAGPSLSAAMSASMSSKHADMDDGFSSFQSSAPAAVAPAASFGGGWDAFPVAPSSAAAPSQRTTTSAPVASTAATVDDIFNATFGFSKKAPAPAATKAATAQASRGGDVSWDLDDGASAGPETASGPPLAVDAEEGNPVPVGVNWRIAKNKGEELYRGGQFGEAIEWLTWARQLAASSGQKATLVEILTTRSSAFKEAGEYKKAIADCSLAIDLDASNTAILMQRGILYESSEKYKLGLADMKEVVRRDPGNRTAVSMVTRLTKVVMANG